MVENACPSICPHFVCPSTLWLSSYFSPYHLSPLFKLISCPKFFSIPFLFGLTVLQQFIVLVCKLSEGDEKKLSMYNLCRTFSILAVSSVRPGTHWDAGNAAHAGQSSAGFCDSHVWICQRELRGRTGQGKATQFYVCFRLRHTVFRTEFTARACCGVLNKVNVIK
jgi:hypothetical protein